MPENTKISAFVVSYNRADVLPTCLASLGFADEVVLVDKSSTDDSVALAADLADRIYVVPWSPTVEETRLFAAARCAHEWIVFLDDDECLSPEAIEFLGRELAAPRADAYALPHRHYVLGTHDPDACYWPENQVRVFRRGTVAFSDTVHGGTHVLSPNLYVVPPETGVAIHNFSHESVFRWIEKSNRYTSRPDRLRPDDDTPDLVAFAHRRIDHWIARSRNAHPGSYAATIALLRALYDTMDRLKAWEEAAGIDGEARFRQARAALSETYRTLPRLRRRAAPAAVVDVRPGPSEPARTEPGPAEAHDAAAAPAAHAHDLAEIKRAYDELLVAARRQAAELTRLRRFEASHLHPVLLGAVKVEREIRRVVGQLRRRLGGT
ncbi:MAG: glycosyltransferase [Rhodovulum sp.]|nr:glycosyltransferase [Rhodovulum sp.]